MTGSTSIEIEMRQSGASSATISAARRSCAGIDEREQEADGDGLDALALQPLRAEARSAASSSGVTTSPSIVEAFATSSVSYCGASSGGF